MHRGDAHVTKPGRAPRRSEPLALHICELADAEALALKPTAELIELVQPVRRRRARIRPRAQPHANPGANGANGPDTAGTHTFLPTAASDRIAERIPESSKERPDYVERLTIRNRTQQLDPSRPSAPST
jgi:hypothetical protein